jgi:uncharacterized membrane protein YkvA (DUF1232 family)
MLPAMLERFRNAAKRLKREVLTLYVALRDPRTPWAARIVGACVVGYALSPIDLIPDFVPVLGLLDDLVIVPAGVWLCLRLMPSDVIERARLEALKLETKPVSLVGLAFMVIVWLMALAWVLRVLKVW